MDLLVGCAWEIGDFVAATDSAFAVIESADLAGFADFEDFDVAGLDVVLVVVVLMTIVVFNFPHLALQICTGQQKTVQKITV
ncbi:MAG: hypothetical protein P8P36_10140 [Akkermansiaceae bacterium]|nr:hypothetical protein [Akkermansiaceae bacterium]